MTWSVGCSLALPITARTDESILPFMDRAVKTHGYAWHGQSNRGWDDLPYQARQPNHERQKSRQDLNQLRGFKPSPLG